MSAIDDSNDGSITPIEVLITMHKGMDTLDFAGPLEVLDTARHDPKNPATKAFKITFVSSSEHTVTNQGASLRAHIDFEEANDRLDDFDVLVVPGGGTDEVLASESEPIPLIKAWTQMQQKDPTKERTLLSICTGSLFLAKAGVLQGLAATTHPNYYTKLEILCQEAARKGDLEQTDVMEERYVVNNARFDLGENPDDNPFILTRKPDGRRQSIALARKGSNAWKESRRRESIIRRATIRLGGLRVITSGGISTGLDASLYLVAALVSQESAVEVATTLQYSWQKGVTVDAVDV
ncbi:class I glutamine amidotransferase-like protein [Rhizodiscina lignyota]|uniref:Class I glutamine amidotransferase-like protein n=1 Tax=Rhizodiscina lignyota TaxID=1504668 RepID=A0A9P4I3S6_9PEZI|nr:class I glutamine amidotransferase-like protein [Rhizodiscina lignyota]